MRANKSNFNSNEPGYLSEAGGISTLEQPDQSFFDISVTPPSNLNRKNYFDDDFTRYADRMNIIRFVAMCSIVWGHTLLGWDSITTKGTNFAIVQAIFIQLGRIGTICFFMISGFFLGEKIYRFNILTYLRHRLFTLIIPWLIFLAFFVAIETVRVVQQNPKSNGSITQIAGIILRLGGSFIFHSAYWFIPISILSALTLIVFKRYINSSWFGLSLTAITLFYGVNLYYGWITVNHTQAFMGYAFFMWLGIQLKSNLHKVKSVIDQLSWTLIFIAVISTFAVSCIEGTELMRIGSADPFASIRISSALVSIVVFMGLLKNSKMTWINYFNPRKSIYGVYLVHCVIIAQVTPLINKYVSRSDQTTNLKSSILIQVAFFLFIITVSSLVVKAIRSSRLKFILGL